MTASKKSYLTPMNMSYIDFNSTLRHIWTPVVELTILYFVLPKHTYLKAFSSLKDFKCLKVTCKVPLYVPIVPTDLQ